MIHTETTLTLSNLSAILSTVSDLEHVAAWLAITVERMHQLNAQQSAPAVNLVSEYFLTHHPAPCWKIVAIALWRSHEVKALEEVQSVYSSSKTLLA